MPGQAAGNWKRAPSGPPGHHARRAPRSITSETAVRFQFGRTAKFSARELADGGLPHRGLTLGGNPPVDGGLEPGRKVRRSTEAEFTFGAADIERAARLAVRFGRVPADLTAEIERLADQPDELPDRDLHVRPKVHRFVLRVTLGRQHDAARRVLHVEKLAARRAVAPDLDEVVTAELGVVDLADQRRNHVRGARIEVIARPIEIDREQEDAVEAVLRAVGLRLDEQHFLRQAVGGVGLLRIAVPEIVFAERHRGELWVGADGADADELFDAVKPRLLHQLGAHHQVVEEQLAGVLPVESDATHLGGEVDHDIHVLDGPAAVLAIDQVEGLRARNCDVSGPRRLELRDDARPEESGAAGHEHAAARPEAHSNLIISETLARYARPRCRVSTTIPWRATPPGRARLCAASVAACRRAATSTSSPRVRAST